MCRVNTEIQTQTTTNAFLYVIKQVTSELTDNYARNSVWT
jgi:hypothetical protein